MSAGRPAVLDGPAAVRARAADLAGRGRRCILGITGMPGAGKSTLAATVVEGLGGAAVDVPMDGFHLAGAELVRLGRADRKGAPDTFDVTGFVAQLGRLRGQADDVVYVPAFDRRLKEPIAGAIPVDPGVPLVVVEGNYLLHPDGRWALVAPLLDECWYVETDEDIRLQRLVERHVAHGKAPDAARDWALGPDQRNAELIVANRWRADLVIRLP